MKLIIALLTALPEIIRLIKTLQENQRENQKAQAIKEDIKKINKAFEDQDAEALRAIFNNSDDV